MMKIQNLPIDSIFHRKDARARSNEAVAELAVSIQMVGLINPIRVRAAGDGYEVVAGSHRLEAMRSLGRQEVACIITNDDDIAAQMAMIAENLHRADLSVLERDEQITLWVRLNSERLSQVAPNPQGGRPATTGVRSAERELGIKRDDASRAVKVASLSHEAKEAAREAGLDNNRTALLEAAKHAAPEDQVAAISARKAERLIQQAEHDRQHDAARAALPDVIKQREQVKADAIAARKGADDVDLTPDDRIAEMEEAVCVLETENSALKTENKLYSEMKVQFEQGGFDKVIAGKDKVIQVLETRVYRESADKASWMKTAKFWQAEAIKLGYSRNVEIDIETSEVTNG